MRRDASTQAGDDPALAQTLLTLLRARLRGRSAPFLIGLSGLQGSGKSTLAAQLARAGDAQGLHVIVLSIDDFYFGRRVRARLGRDVHPLLQTRGVPGTHDIGLLEATLAGLARATGARPAYVPRFDKGLDTRLPPSRWRKVTRRPRLIILEGWCVGVPAQGTADLPRAVNSLERDEDGDGGWRGHVNAQLMANYQPLWRRLGALILLEAPGYAVVSQWRDEQERPLRARRAPQALDAAALARFLMHYERLSRHALRVLPALADIRIVLDRRRRVSDILPAPRGRLVWPGEAGS